MRSPQERRLAAADPRVERVIICTPDKDLAQCVRGTRVVQLNRRTRITFDEAGVVKKFGVLPASIPDYLALVGDTADGYPGLEGWGAKSSAAVLSKYLSPRGDPRRSSRVARERRERGSAGTSRSNANANTRCCFEPLRRSEPTSRCSPTWRNCGGTGRQPRLRRWRRGWTRR